MFAPDRRDHARFALELHAQPLEHAAEIHRQHVADAERAAVQLLFILGHLDVLGPHHRDHLVARDCRRALGVALGAGEEALAEPQPRGAALAEKQVGRAEEGGDEARGRTAIEGLGAARSRAGGRCA